MRRLAFSFASHTTTSAVAVVRKPENISFEEAATIPITFLTAHYALNVLGRIDAGEPRADPRRRGRRRPGGIADLPARRCRGLRHGRQPGEARLPPIARRRPRLRFAVAGLRRRNPRSDARRGRGRGAELAARRGHPQKPRPAAGLRPFPGDRQDRHLPEPHAWPGAIPGQPIVLRHRPRPPTARAAASGAADVPGNHGTVPGGPLSAAAAQGVRGVGHGRRLPLHGAAKEHRQSRRFDAAGRGGRG